MDYRKVRTVNLDGSDVPLRCKSFSCPDCGPWLRRRLKKAFIHAAEANPGLTRFFTLTMRPSARQLTLKERFRELHGTFAKFAKRIERREGRRFRYASVRESHKDGTPHIHGLMDAYRPWHEVRRDWMASGGGSQVYLEQVDIQRVSAYLAKYLIKDDKPLPRRCRKYASGGGIKLEDVRPRPSRPGTWWIQAWGPTIRSAGARKGELGWTDVHDPRALFGQLAGEPPPAKELRDVVAAMITRRELQHVADNLVVCVVCGGDHAVHSR